MRLAVVFLVLVLVLLARAGAGQPARPNFVFLVSEDNSVHYLRLYGNPLGATPHIERLAAEGVTFDHAFSCAPVCSVARSTLATGLYAPGVGFQYHRRSVAAALPRGFRPWSALLRQAGYYATNNAKTDYNFVHDLRELWDESSNRASWRNRPSRSTPFFHMESWPESHESALHFSAAQMARERTTTPPEAVTLAPYHPDTPAFRYTHARYSDRMQVIDAKVGSAVEALRRAGVLEDTFVFYFGDHGGVLPGSKGYAYDRGLHVPLVVRIPEHFRHLIPIAPGARTPNFVEFVDLGPTVLQLAGVDVPRRMDGRPFLTRAGIGSRDSRRSEWPSASGDGGGVRDGERAARGRDFVLAAGDARTLGAQARGLPGGRDTAFGYADRMDEKYDFVRTLRKGRFAYVRNFTGFYADGLQNNYRYRMLAYAEWRQLFRAGKLNAVQSAFFRPRPPEQLFDLEADPHQVRDLAAESRYRDTLRELRALLRRRLLEIHDLSFYPESELVRVALADGASFGAEHAAEIRKLARIADLELIPFARASTALKQALASANPWERYWACIAATAHGKAAAALVPAITPLLEDEQLMVRVRAAEFLGTVRAADPMPALYDVLNAAATEPELLMAHQAVVYLRDQHGWAFDPLRLRPAAGRGEAARRVEYLKTPGLNAEP